MGKTESALLLVATLALSAGRADSGTLRDSGGGASATPPAAGTAALGYAPGTRGARRPTPALHRWSGIARHETNPFLHISRSLPRAGMSHPYGASRLTWGAWTRAPASLNL